MEVLTLAMSQKLILYILHSAGGQYISLQHQQHITTQTIIGTPMPFVFFIDAIYIFDIWNKVNPLVTF